jgi:hypothetical protein
VEALVPVLPKNFLLILTVLNFLGADPSIEVLPEEVPAAGELIRTKDEVGISTGLDEVAVGVAEMFEVSVGFLDMGVEVRPEGFNESSSRAASFVSSSD